MLGRAAYSATPSTTVVAPVRSDIIPDSNFLTWPVYLALPFVLIFMMCWSSAELAYSSAFINEDSGCDLTSSTIKLTPVGWMAIMGTVDLVFTFVALFMFIYAIACEVAKFIDNSLLRLNESNGLENLKDKFPNASKADRERLNEIDKFLVKGLSYFQSQVSSSSNMQQLSFLDRATQVAWKPFVVFTVLVFIFNCVFWWFGAFILWGNNPNCAFDSLKVFMSLSVVFHMLFVVFACIYWFHHYAQDHHIEWVEAVETNIVKFFGTLFSIPFAFP